MKTLLKTIGILLIGCTCNVYSQYTEITQTGTSIGVGTTTPSTKLDVNGTTTITPTTGEPSLILNRNPGIASIKGTSTGDGRMIVIDPGLPNFGVYLNHYVAGHTFISSASTSKVGIGTGAITLEKKVQIVAPSDDGLAINAGNAFLGKTTLNTWTQLLYWNGESSYYGRDVTGGVVKNHYFRTNGLDRLSILENGNVGIGTTTPEAKLHVNGSMKLNGSFNQLGSAHYVFANTSGHGIINFGNNGVGDLAFRSLPTGGDINTYNQLMILTNDGKLGVGTATPVTKLDVNGDIHAPVGSSFWIGDMGVNRLRLYHDGTDAYIDFNDKLQFRNGEDDVMSLDGSGALITSEISTGAVKASMLKVGTAHGPKLLVNNTTWPNVLILRTSNTASTGDYTEIKVPGATANTASMRLMQNGNVGIGVDNPTSTLDIASTNNNGIRIGKVGETATLTVPVGELAGQFNIDFTGYRDMSQDQIGARISALRFNNHLDNSALIQNTGLAFYTNPSGMNTGTTDLVERMRILPNGSVGINTTTTGNHKLAVEGSIGAREIKVYIGAWADYVFDKNYQLPSLTEVENHIKVNGHLKDIPSTSEVLENGISLGEMQAKLLQKVEELTLYSIQQQKEIQILKSELESLKK